MVAAAHLLRYLGDERVGESFRGTGEIKWLVFDPAGYQAFLVAAGFRELTRTRRGWTR